MGDFIKTLTSLIGSIKAKTDGKIGILQKRIDDIPTETVLYTPQTLTEEQQKQARNNIGAESSFIINITGSESSGWKADKTFQEIDAAVASGVMPVCKMPKHVTESYGYGVCYYAFKLEPPFGSNVFFFRNLDTDKTYSAYTVVEISSSNDVDVRRTTLGMVGATETEPGDSGYVPSPQSGDNTKFLRGDGRWADVEGDTSLGITGAQIGQIAKITAVDTDGKPTKWEPVDMASGGGEREWVEIGEVTTTEDTTEKMTMKFTQDVHGNPLSLKGVLIIGKPIFSDTNKHQCLLVCNDNKYGGNANYLLYEQILRNNQTFTVYSEFLRADGINSVAVTAFNSGNVKQNGGCGTSVNTWSPGNDISLQFPMRGVAFTILDTGLLAGSNFKFWGVNA